VAAGMCKLTARRAAVSPTTGKYEVQRGCFGQHRKHVDSAQCLGLSLCPRESSKGPLHCLNTGGVANVHMLWSVWWKKMSRYEVQRGCFGQHRKHVDSAQCLGLSLCPREPRMCVHVRTHACVCVFNSHPGPSHTSMDSTTSSDTLA
jgi:hypothetical protein